MKFSSFVIGNLKFNIFYSEILMLKFSDFPLNYTLDMINKMSLSNVLFPGQDILYCLTITVYTYNTANFMFLC